MASSRWPGGRKDGNWEGSLGLQESSGVSFVNKLAPDIRQIGYLILFCDHGPHHVAGIFRMIGDGADDFSQPYQVIHGYGIINAVKNFFFYLVFQLVRLMFMLPQGANHVFY